MGEQRSEAATMKESEQARFRRLPLEIGSAKPGRYFFTSNVDGQFQRAGFAAERMVECPGAIHHLQCTAPCADEIWDAESETVNIEESTFRALEPLPQCRNCPALARPNILMFGDWSWLGHRTDAQQQRFAGWLNGLVKILSQAPKRRAVPSHSRVRFRIAV